MPGLGLFLIVMPVALVILVPAWVLALLPHVITAGGPSPGRRARTVGGAGVAFDGLTLMALMAIGPAWFAAGCFLLAVPFLLSLAALNGVYRRPRS